MSLAIVTDSTCDLREDELAALRVRRVPLYVHFRDHAYKDWIEITPNELIEGVQQGADMPTTSQPTPEDFAAAFRDAAADGADRILVVTLAKELSGTHQSAVLAAKDAPVPVTVFDSNHASLGAAYMVRRAAAMRDAEYDLDAITENLGRLREVAFLLFTVGTLEFLQKGGRIGRAGALVGSLLNIKPLLTIEEGVVQAAGRARGAKKALREMTSRLRAYREAHPEGELVVTFVHIQSESAVSSMAEAFRDAGISFRDGGTYELGAVIGVHVGPGTYGFYALADPTPELGM
ncbi:MAG: DegV family protein [Trueperaceae bacterium]|nr:DegV family protein [Trueperaceae bacterium]